MSIQKIIIPKSRKELLADMRKLTEQSYKQNKHLIENLLNELENGSITIQEFNSRASEISYSKGLYKLFGYLTPLIEQYKKSFPEIKTITPEVDSTKNIHAELLANALETEDQNEVEDEDNAEAEDDVENESNGSRLDQNSEDVSTPDFVVNFVNDLLIQFQSNVEFTFDSFKESLKYLKIVKKAQDGDLNLETISQIRSKLEIQASDENFDIENYIKGIQEQTNLKIAYLVVKIANNEELDLELINQDYPTKIFTEEEFILAGEIFNSKPFIDPENLIYLPENLRQFALEFKTSLEKHNLTEDMLDIIKATVALIYLDNELQNELDFSAEISARVLWVNLSKIYNAIEFNDLDELLSLYLDLLETPETDSFDVIKICLQAPPEFTTNNSPRESRRKYEKLNCAKSQVLLDVCDNSNTEINLIENTEFVALNSKKYRGFHLPSLNFLVFIADSLGDSVILYRMGEKSLDESIEYLSETSNIDLYKDENYGIINLVGSQNNHITALTDKFEKFIENPCAYIGKFGFNKDSILDMNLNDYILGILNIDQKSFGLSQIRDILSKSVNLTQTVLRNISNLLIEQEKNDYSLSNENLLYILNVFTNESKLKTLATVSTRNQVSKLMEIGLLRTSSVLEDHSHNYEEVLEDSLQKLKKKQHTLLEKTLLACIKHAYIAYKFNDTNRGNYYVAKSKLIKKLLDSKINPKLFINFNIDLFNIVFNHEIIDVELNIDENEDGNTEIRLGSITKANLERVNIRLNSEQAAVSLSKFSEIITMIEKDEIKCNYIILNLLKAVTQRIEELYSFYSENILESLHEDTASFHIINLYRDLHRIIGGNKLLDQFNMEAYFPNGELPENYEGKYTRISGRLEELIQQVSSELADELRNLTKGSLRSLTNSDPQNLIQVIKKALI